MSNNKYEEWSRDELIAEIKQLKKRKKFGLVWEDKPEDVVEQCKTNLPVLEEVKDKEINNDPDKPMNILIEGDNYHALSVLNYTHKGKIDVIYIDPPYNTGKKDFEYNDMYIDKEDPYRHSKWLSFMKGRIELTFNLLKNTGILICSIDDNELAQLKLLLDEIFNENNHIATLPTVMNLKGNQDQFGFAGTHEYTLVYCKNKECAKFKEYLVQDEEFDKWMEDDIGYFKKGANLKATGMNAPRLKRQNLYYPIFITKDAKVYVSDNDQPINNDDFVLLPITDDEEMSWRWEKAKVKKDLYDIILEKNGNTFTIYKKQRPKLDELPTIKPKTLFYKPAYSSGNGTAQLKKMFSDKVFNNPKPIELIKDLIILSTREDSLILDFFAGSGTTGHATLDLNNEDKGKRKFILCTNNEGDICTDVCYPRIRKVIEGYSDNKGNLVQGLSGNLKYYKTAFVPSGDTDNVKKNLTQNATEMICLKEYTFELIYQTTRYVVFKNSEYYTGIIYDYLAIDEFKKYLKTVKGKFHIYIFSLSDETFEEEFSDVKSRVRLSPIPEAILRVYRKIFKER